MLTRSHTNVLVPMCTLTCCADVQHAHTDDIIHAFAHVHTYTCLNVCCLLTYQIFFVQFCYISTQSSSRDSSCNPRHNSMFARLPRLAIPQAGAAPPPRRISKMEEGDKTREVEKAAADAERA